MNSPCALGCPFDSWYCVTAPSRPLAKPRFVLSGFEPSVLKLSDPLNVDARCAGRVVCSTKTPVFRLWAPFTLVRLPDTLNSVLKPKKGQRLSTLNAPTVPGMPPLKLACGSRLSGFASGKNCWNEGSTLV